MSGTFFLFYVVSKILISSCFNRINKKHALTAFAIYNETIHFYGNNVHAFVQR